MHERRHHNTHAHLQCADGWVLCSCFVVLGHRRDTKNENEHLNNLTLRCFDIVSKAWCTPYKFFLFEVCIYIPGRERMERESNCYGPTGDAYIDRDAAAIAQQSGGIAWLQCVYVVRSTQRAYEIIIKALKSPRTSNYAKLSVFLPFVVGRLLARADSWWLYSWWWWSSLSSSSLPHNVSRLKSYMPGCCEGNYTGRTVVGPQRLEAYTHHSRFIIKRKACCVCALLWAYVSHCRTTHTHTHSCPLCCFMPSRLRRGRALWRLLCALKIAYHIWVRESAPHFPLSFFKNSLRSFFVIFEIYIDGFVLRRFAGFF